MRTLPGGHSSCFEALENKCCYTGMEMREAQLELLWRNIADGAAPVQSKIDAAWVTGEMRAVKFIPCVEELLLDESEEVRYYALQCLVLDLHQVEHEATCWRFLRDDSSDDVRALAAACIGSIYEHSFAKATFDSLESELHSASQSPEVKGSVRTALRTITGLVPTDPASLSSWTRPFGGAKDEWAEIQALRERLTGWFTN
jgi:HEAT repeat protein